MVTVIHGRLWVFEMVAYAHIPKDVKGKLDPRSKPLIVLVTLLTDTDCGDKCRIVTAFSVKFLEETEPCNVESKSHESVIPIIDLPQIDKKSELTDSKTLEGEPKENFLGCPKEE
ncbi:hypothetical protein PR048_001698 [Dryococelus australis]|uniref:Uncharacterized protein n=1 Tax=Dryococelus australis TaxID=614101 RepID=A0ABQ9II96_9NEOP|nr:hypothetical protein PR048_001698 [Dryococelus australis]